MVGRLLTIVVFTLVFAGAAHAQQSVGDHFRAYRAAIEAGNLATAENAAAAALALSESTDGDGGRTAVLALNLASVRLALGRAPDAEAPALRARTIAAERGADSGVDLALADLVLAHVRFGQSPGAGRDALAAALANVAGRGDFDVQAYDAAVALGHWALSERDFAIARPAWDAAVQHAGGSAEAAAFAQSYQAVGMLFGRQPGAPSGDLDQVRALAIQAADVLRPMAEAPGQTGDLTPVQRAYATAMAVQSAADIARGPQVDPERCALALGPGDYDAALPFSMAEIPHEDFPDGKAFVGVVVLRIVTEASGRLERADVAAAFPAETMVGSGQRLIRRLRESRPWRDDCIAPRIQFVVQRYRTLPDADPPPRVGRRPRLSPFDD